MENNYLNKILQRILENINTTTNVGIVIASPSEDPPYKYHWTRDSALVMRTIVSMFKKTKESIYFKLIMNYIENESKLQELNPIAGLGEPKFNINCSEFMGEWGRPQNDGPALRGIILYNVINEFRFKYDVIISKLIIPIIEKDLNYIMDNYNKVSFDIWEEKLGWHFYTRLVQLKFIKDSIKFRKMLKNIDIDRLREIDRKLSDDIKDHINDTSIISSFDENGKIIKYEDAANILAFSHINYDEEILKIIPLEFITHTCDNLILAFRKKYNNDELNLIGRYIDDKYYDGQIWIICSLALAQVYIELYRRRNIVKYDSPMHRSKSNPNNNFIEIANEILELILSLDSNLILPEQFNPNTKEFISAKKLTWNYSELYNLHNLLN